MNSLDSCPPPEGGSSLPQGGSMPPQGGSKPAVDAGSVARGAALIGVSALASLFLAACGGDSSSPAPTPTSSTLTEMPASATTSDLALEVFAIGQPQEENTEPFALDNVSTFPTSETEEPIAID